MPRLCRKWVLKVYKLVLGSCLIVCITLWMVQHAHATRRGCIYLSLWLAIISLSNEIHACAASLVMDWYDLVMCQSSWKVVVAVVLSGYTNLARTTAEVPSSESFSTRFYSIPDLWNPLTLKLAWVERYICILCRYASQQQTLNSVSHWEGRVYRH